MAYNWTRQSRKPVESRIASTLRPSKQVTSPYSSSFDNISSDRIPQSAYWSRLWAIQETCVPRLLCFIYNSYLWSCGDLRLCELPNPHAMLRILNTRGTEHTDTMTLESLLRLSARQTCSDPRDRTYGLLGLANDVHPLPRTREGCCFTWPSADGSVGGSSSPNRRQDVLDGLFSLLVWP